MLRHRNLFHKIIRGCSVFANHIVAAVYKNAKVTDLACNLPDVQSSQVRSLRRNAVGYFVNRVMRRIGFFRMAIIILRPFGVKRFFPILYKDFNGFSCLEPFNLLGRNTARLMNSSENYSEHI